MKEPIIFDFNSPTGVTGRFTFMPEESRLLVDFGPSGKPTKTLQFNNIGDADPIEFLSELDWGYVRGEIYGNGYREHDLLGSLATLHRAILAPEEFDMSPGPDDVRKARAKANSVMQAFDGNEQVACHQLIEGFRHLGFLDDPHHMLKMRERQAVTDFRHAAWEPLKAAMNEFLNSSMESPFKRPEEVEATVVDVSREGSDTLFRVRLVHDGTLYGKDMALQHEGDDPLVEFYALSASAEGQGDGARVEGHFISRYTLASLEGKAPGSTRNLFAEGLGIDLEGGNRDWWLDGAAMRKVGEMIAGEGYISMPEVEEDASMEPS